jgi:4-amino-4-deoxy-L-arabinose transferase-like glycosyltransferase
VVTFLLRYARWVPILWIVVFWRLGYTSLLDPDEAHYAQLTREMMRARSWFVPLLDDAPLIDKPVLFHWFQMLFVEVFGPSELAMRLPSAIAAIALILTTWWAGTKLLGKGVGDRAAMMFATLPITFALSSVGIFDMAYTAFLFGGLACLLVSALNQRERLQYVGFALLALAVMTKGPVALVLVVLFIAAAAIDRKLRRPLQRIHWGVGALIIIVAAQPWFLWMWGKFGDRFVRDYLLAGNFWYFTEPAAFSTRRASDWFYFRILATAFFPWSTIAAGHAIDSVRAWRAGRPLNPAERLLWLWTLTVLAFFSAARFKLDYYIFPAAPAICILTADAWQRATDDMRRFATRAATAVVALVMIALGAVSSVVLFRIDLGLDRSAELLPAVLVTGGTILLIEMARRSWRLPSTLAVPTITLLSVYGLVVVLGFPVLERTRPTAPLGKWIARHTREGTPVGVYRMDKWRASIRYYSDRQVSQLHSPDELTAFFDGQQKRYVLMLRADYRDLRRAGVPVRRVTRRRAVVGASGKFFRKQIWSDLLVVTAKTQELLVSTTP